MTFVQSHFETASPLRGWMEGLLLMSFLTFEKNIQTAHKQLLHSISGLLLINTQLSPRALLSGHCRHRQGREGKVRLERQGEAEATQQSPGFPRNVIWDLNTLGRPGSLCKVPQALAAPSCFSSSLPLICDLWVTHATSPC